MPIPVACPGCSARLNAPDAAAGKRVKCPKCQTPVPVPAAAFEEVEDEPAEEVAERPRPKPRRRDDDDDEDDRPRPKKRRTPADSGGVPAAAWVAGGLGLAAAVGVALWLTLGNRGDGDGAAAAGNAGGGGPFAGAAEAGQTLKPGEKRETRRASATVEPGPDGWAAVDDPTHGFAGELPGRAFPGAMAENNPKVVADRGYHWAEWKATGPEAGYEAEVLIFRRTAADPYPADPAGLWQAFEKTQLKASRLETTKETVAPATLGGRPAAEVRYRRTTFKERSVRSDPSAAAEPDDPTDVPDHTVLRVTSDGRWLYAVRFEFRQRKPDEAVLKRVFDSIKLSPPSGG